MSKILLHILGVLTTAAVATAGQVTVHTIGGDTHTGTLTALTVKAVTVTTKDKPVTVPAKDLAEVTFAPPAPDPMNVAGRKIIRTAGGGLLAAETIAIADGRVTLKTALTGEVTMALDKVIEIILPGEKATAAAVLTKSDRAGTTTEKTSDRLFVRTPRGRFLAVTGALTGLSAEKISFDYDRESRTIDTAKVARIVLAQTQTAAAGGLAVGTDGTRLPFGSVTMKDGQFALTGTPFGPLALQVGQLAALRFGTDRVRYLSEMKPTRVAQAGTLGPGLPHRRDLSARGRPLQLDGRIYARGLGLHSRCELTYALAGQYRQLLARAGIDDGARPGGHATLTITADGKTLLGPLILTGKDPSRPIRLDVAGADILTILVDFGDNLDIGDHVDLADARLIK